MKSHNELGQPGLSVEYNVSPGTENISMANVNHPGQGLAPVEPMSVCAVPHVQQAHPVGNTKAQHFKTRNTPLSYTDYH